MTATYLHYAFFTSILPFKLLFEFEDVVGGDTTTILFMNYIPPSPDTKSAKDKQYIKKNDPFGFVGARGA